MKTSYICLLRTAALASMLAMAGCLSGGGGSSSSAAPNPTPPPATNTPPTISGNPPPEIQVGQSYSFTPTASDSDGDTLTFSIANSPSWASFDSGTGRISGTPSLADVGQYPDVRVSVSDGQATSAMAGFTIDVNQIGTFSTTLSWTAPTLNEDGSALTDLAGFKIYYGNSSGDYPNEIRIDNPSITTFVVDDLSLGTYYFAATAFNMAGEESRFSGEAVRILN